MLVGEYHEICPSHCPHRTGSAKEILPVPSENSSKEFRENLEILKSDIATMRTKLRARPVSLRLLPSIRCNLQCIMCWQRVEDDRDLPDHFYEELRPLLPLVGRMILQGGEPLLIRRCRELLAECTKDKYPDLQLGMITNGTLISEKFLESIQSVNIPWLFISLDAATSETYLRIRGGYFDEVCAGIRRVKRLRPDISVIIGFVVMEENVHEILSFIHLAEELGVDFEFSPLNPGFQKGNDFGLEDFRQRVSAAISEAESYLSEIGFHNKSLETVKCRMWNERFGSFR
jgi:MoaA/NifB/PqqE/SkfB family radical SAM enzyme